MFGRQKQINPACRGEWSPLWLEDVVRDIGYSLRLLRRSPVFTCAAIFSLALGIGANTAICSLMDLVMLRMMPVREPERLVQLTKLKPGTGREGFCYPLFQHLQQNLKSFDGMFAHWSPAPREISIAGNPENVKVDWVSGSYFDVLGVSALAGRTFSSEVDRPGASPFAVISYGFWKRQFGSDPAVIGKTFHLNQIIFPIIVLTPREFFGVYAGRSPDITMPLSMARDAVIARGLSSALL